MPYLIRAINRENWPEPNELDDIGQLIADALNDITTSENKLSVWYAEDGEDLYNAIIAYLGTMDKWVIKDSVDFVAIDMQDIKDADLPIDLSSNFTYIKGYEDKHRDIIDLNYSSIETIAKIIIKSIEDGRDYIMDTGKIKELFVKAIMEDRIHSSDINKGNHGRLFKYLREIEQSLENK